MTAAGGGARRAQCVGCIEPNYSFNPFNSSCDFCPVSDRSSCVNMECDPVLDADKGCGPQGVYATMLVPAVDYWHSSAQSLQFHR